MEIQEGTFTDTETNIRKCRHIHTHDTHVSFQYFLIWPRLPADNPSPQTTVKVLSL